MARCTFENGNYCHHYNYGKCKDKGKCEFKEMKPRAKPNAQPALSEVRDIAKKAYDENDSSNAFDALREIIDIIDANFA